MSLRSRGTLLGATLCGGVLFTLVLVAAGPGCDDGTDSEPVKKEPAAAPAPATPAAGQARIPADLPTFVDVAKEAGLAVMDADGADSRRVAASTGGAVAWTADGSTLSFVSGDWINLVRPDGTGLTRLLEGDSPTWRTAP